MTTGQPNLPSSRRDWIYPHVQGDEFQPSHFVDREEEQSLFARVSELVGDDRILVLKDVPECGKSMLLHQFEHTCRTRALPLPVARISFDKDHARTEFELADQIYKRLSNHIQLTRSRTCWLARAARDFSHFAPRDTSVYGVVNATNVSVAPGGTANFIGVQSFGSPQWSAEMDDLVMNECVNTLFSELHVLGSASPLVLMFDACEACSPKMWQCLLDRLRGVMGTGKMQTSKLMLVFSGCALPAEIAVYLPREMWNQIRVFPALKTFTAEYLLQLTKALDLKYLQDKDMDYLVAKLEVGWPLGRVVALAKITNHENLSVIGRRT